LIVLDTSVLVAHLGPSADTPGPMLDLLESDEAVRVPAVVLYEWWRGPRREHELEIQRRFFPQNQVLPFGAVEARTAAEIYRQVRRARGRDTDIAIAACALVAEAQLWTLNEKDFVDIPGLRLYRPPLQ